MICKNCGAEYDDNMLQCPFCNAENTEEAYRRQRDYVDGYKRKAHFLSRLPEWIVGITGNAMKHIAIIAMVLFLIVVLLAFIGTKIYSATAVWRMDRAVAKMERYYQAGEYEKLKEYYYNTDYIGGAAYEKYDRTVHVYARMDWLMYELEKLDSDYVAYVTVEEVEDALDDVMGSLHDIEEMEEAGFIYDEEKAMLEFKEQILDAVEIYVPMTEEEFQTAYDRYNPEEDTDYAEEAEIIVERLGEE